jgi:hypothetical protein
VKEDRPEGRALHQILLMLNLGMGEDEKKSPGLVDLLHRSRQALASNPRDYVYGFLGLTSSTYRAKISVGYEESVADTFGELRRRSSSKAMASNFSTIYIRFGFRT